MSKTVQWKRGNTAVNSTYTGAQGEITVDTTDWSLYVHDGITPGGYKISNDSDINVNIGNLGINDQTISGTVSGRDITISPIAGNIIVTGNILPNTNVALSLGSSTQQWKDLWVSNNTIYINSVPFTLTSGNTLTINGNPILSSNTTNSVTTTGNVTANYFFGDGSNLTGISTTGDFTFSGTTMEAEEMLIQSTDADIIIKSDSDIFANVTNKTLVIETNAGNWTFDGATGNLTLPTNSASINYANGSAYGGGGGGNTFSSITMTSTPSGPSDQIKYGLGNLVVWNDGGWVIGEYNGSDYATEGIRINPGIEGAVDITLPADSLANNTPTSISNFIGNVVVNTGYNYVSFYQWKFDNTGNLILPDSSPAPGINYANGTPYGGGSTGQWSFNSDTAYNGTGNGLYIQASQGTNDGGAYFPYEDEGTTTRLYNISGAGIELSAGANTWIFNPDSSIQFPQINTPRGDNPSGSIYGYTLVIGDGENEAVITTPNGDPAGGQNSQRLVINPGKGADETFGEGGDIYLWAGRGGSSGGSGGDVKIRGGYGPEDGDGGYIRMEGGEAFRYGEGGFIEINGGTSGQSTGGYIDINAGQGATGGGVTLEGGLGVLGPGGSVQLIGGTSANGFGEYGSVSIQSGINTWTFDNTGNLVLNSGSRIKEVLSPVLGNYALSLTGTGITDPDQQLLIYPTTLDANHMHLTTGNLYNTELYLGNDDLYVKLNNTGNISLSANDLIESALWQFGVDGNITLPQSGVITEETVPGGFPGSAIVIKPDGFINDNQRLLVYPTGGVDYNHLHLTSGNLYDTELFLGNDDLYVKLANSGNIVINANDSAGNLAQWTFDINGNLNTPGNIVTAGTGGDITMTGGNITGVSNITANTFISDSYNVLTAGNLSITSQYGLGVTGTILEDGGTLELIGVGSGLGTTGCVVVGWNSTYGGLSDVAQIYFNPPGSSGNAVLTTGNTAGTSYEWTFGADGKTILPGNSILTAPSGAFLTTLTFSGNVYTQQNQDTNTWEIYSEDDTTGPYSAWSWIKESLYTVDTPEVIIENQKGSDGIPYRWTFDAYGNLTLPTNSAAIKYANGTSILEGIAGGTYGDSDVANFLADFGSNNILTTGNVLASYLIATDSGNVLSLTTRSGDSNNSNANPQIIMGYAGTADYPSFIHTTHNAGTPVDNTIEFWTSDGTQAGTFPANAVLGLTVTNGNIKTGGILTDNYLYANGTPVSFSGGGGSNYGNSNVVTLLASFGSNNITTTGNITGANITATANLLINGYGKFAGTFDESIGSNQGVVLGYAGGTPRILFGTGNTQQTFEIDNDGGTLRFYQPGSTKASLTSTGHFSASGNVTGGNLITSGLVSVTGNITGGNLITASSANVILGNASSYVKQNGSNARINLSSSITLTPDTNADPLAGVIIGGYGYLLAPNGTRNATLNYNSVNGALGFATNVTVGSSGSGSANINGISSTGINAIFAGVTNTVLPNTIASFNSSVNNYTQITLQNKNAGADATADYIITADNGSDTVNYLDLGIINSGYDNTTPTNSLGNIVFAADSYIYAQGNASATSQSGGNLAIGTTTTGKSVKIFAGGANASSIIATVSNTGVAVTGNVTASNFVGNITITGNVTGTSPNVTLVAGSYSATMDNTGYLSAPTLKSTNSSGNEGGEIQLAVAPNATISGSTVTVDQYVDRIRFFEGGGTTRGAYIDLSQAAAGVGTLLNNRVSGLVNAGTYVTMDLLKATVTTSGNRGLSLAATTGSFSILIGATFAISSSSASGGSAASGTINTTPSSSQFGWNFTGAGDISTYIITDTTNSRAYRIVLQIGASYNNNMISIERLV